MSMNFTWTASGTEITSSPGATERGEDVTGTIEADGVGEVVEWLAARSPIWDVLDQECAVTIEIVPT